MIADDALGTESRLNHFSSSFFCTCLPYSIAWAHCSYGSLPSYMIGRCCFHSPALGDSPSIQQPISHSSNPPGTIIASVNSTQRIIYHCSTGPIARCLVAAAVQFGPFVASTVL